MTYLQQKQQIPTISHSVLHNLGKEVISSAPA